MSKTVSNKQKLDTIYRQETIRTVGVVVSVTLQLAVLLILMEVI